MEKNKISDDKQIHKNDDATQDSSHNKIKNINENTNENTNENINKIKSKSKTTEHITSSKQKNENNVIDCKVNSFGYPNIYCKENVDEFFHNPYMETGYRVGYNIKDCACSIFLFHNEIWNIWTHLLPAIIISFSYILLFQKGFFEMSNWIDSLMIHINFCGTIIGLSLSSIYHTFNCNSKQVHNCLLCCDMGGLYFLW